MGGEEQVKWLRYKQRAAGGSAGRLCVTPLALRDPPSSPVLRPAVPPADPVVEGGPVVKLKAHTPHNLTCRASGAKPAADITWYRDGEIQESAVYAKVGGTSITPPHTPHPSPHLTPPPLPASLSGFSRVNHRITHISACPPFPLRRKRV